MPATVNTSRPFRPFNWIAVVAGLMLAAYVLGAASAADAPQPTAVCTSVTDKR